MTAIDWQALPSAEAFDKAGQRSLEELVDAGILPSFYAGTRKSTYTALALLNQLELRSFEEIISRPKNKDGELTKELEYAGFHMYALDSADAYLHWSFFDIFGYLDYEEGSKITDYFCYLASGYSGETLSNVTDILHSIIPFQVQEFNRKVAEFELPTLAEYQNIFELSKILHDEGVVMATNYLWLASRHWSSKTVLSLIEERLPIIKAFQLYQMGFTTLEEMKEYNNMIPEDWLARIMGDEDDSDTFDYSF